jgi:hypothetical protein
MRKTIATILAVAALSFAVGSAEARKTHPSELSWFASILGMIWIDD